MNRSAFSLILALCLLGGWGMASEKEAAQTVPPAARQALPTQLPTEPMSVPEPIWSSVAAAAAIAFLRRRK